MQGRLTGGTTIIKGTASEAMLKCVIKGVEAEKVDENMMTHAEMRTGQENMSMKGRLIMDPSGGGIGGYF